MLRKHVVPLLLGTAVILPLPLLALVVIPEHRWCMQQAVGEREWALLSMQQQYNRDIERAMDERGRAQIDAWSMEDDRAIMDADSQAQRRFSEMKSDADRRKSEAESEIRNQYREAERRCQEEKRRREEEERRRQEEERRRIEEDRRRQQEEDRRLRQQQDEERRRMQEDERRRQDEDRRRQQEEDRLRRDEERRRQEEERRRREEERNQGEQCYLSMACHFSTPSCLAPVRMVRCDSSECRNAGSHQGRPLCVPADRTTPPIGQRPSGRKCISDDQCGGGHCSMRHGCLPYCDDPTVICPAVCAGICERGPAPNPPIVQQPPVQQPPSSGKCTSSGQCGSGNHCSTEDGDCLRLCDDPMAICPAVCAGFCRSGPSRFPVFTGSSYPSSTYYPSTNSYNQPSSYYNPPYYSPSTYSTPYSPMYYSPPYSSPYSYPTWSY